MIASIGTTLFVAALAFLAGFVIGGWRGMAELKLADRERFLEGDD
jgi:hypothetical protein